MNKNKFIKTILTFVLVLAVSSMFAQGSPTEPGDDTDDPEAPLNPAPISDYLLPMLVLGVATAYVLLRKKTTQQVS